MIKSAIIHPQLISSLALCGHKTQILIADANYAFKSNAPKGVEIIYLNLAPGTIPATLILERLLEIINVEQATMMNWPTSFQNTIIDEYQACLPASCTISYLEREDFYNKVRSEMTLMVIASGETRCFANLLLTVAPVILD
ncbi:RbsD/FucU transporter [Salmonella enterica]|uniref:RbsD/FucU transporter n=1 Tax=Salmonella enterica TaxID=28901 RepID=A0A5V1ADK3_SALER|nr:RbsD/FucU domain-containing protein [Salmonella enterica]EDG0478549.1 RbsD/FucU transporter [Salmonella enterica subsp. enterica serovar Newport]EDS5051609.1 RbsD/FucU transporter [Salmonella enterica subsp. enterica serovar Javiana]EFT0778507.1 RbsD/FucU transporter [Salmonella enterica subsp. enterica serovar Amager]EAN1870866.1 RbsD/FucU transporter [Salmonella enterica]EAS5177735.1 RbsD/FucU transporter [Salmonella enterica]